MEGNCHFLEFSGFKTGRQSLVRPSAAQRNASAPRRVAALHPEWHLTQPLRSVDGEQARESGWVEATSTRRVARMSRLVAAKYQGVAKQVLLYCFRVGNCGTFMPLSCVRGEFRIAVVWTQIVAAFSAISSVHFRVLFTHPFSLSAVGCR